MQSPRAPGAGIAGTSRIPSGGGIAVLDSDPARELQAAAAPLHLSWFPTAIRSKGPAYGIPRDTTWGRLCDALRTRRQGEKDGPCFVPARFQLEPDGMRVRRLGRNLLARTVIVLDIEANTATGELPPTLSDAVARVRALGWASAGYTSHKHTAAAQRYRLVFPISEEIDHELPAVEVVAGELGLGGVLDTSKCGAASPFYLPSCPPGRLDDHEAAVVDGAPIAATWVREAAGKLLAARQAEQTRIAAEAHAQAELRRQVRIASGTDPDNSLIEKIRVHLDLKALLLAHGYDRDRKGKFRHPNSQSGSFGADIKGFAGIDRIYSHNATDPLHRNNLPEWCGGVTALDAVDVAIILDHAGNRKHGLRELAKRFGLDKSQARKAVAALIYRMRNCCAPQLAIEAAALATGASSGLSQAEVCAVARHVVTKISKREAA